MPNYKSTKIRKLLARWFLSFIAIGITGVIIVSLFISVDTVVSNENKKTTESGLTTEIDQKKITTEVTEHQPIVEKYLKERGLEQFTGLFLAIMMQESGGRGNDPMQASESLCGEVGCIDEPEVSIKQGIKYFSNVLEKADGDIKLALQSYNFGAGFINYVNKHGGEYTKELAIDFSSMKYEELYNTGKYSCLREEAKQYGACYGDIKYVDAVLAYYDDAKTYTNSDDTTLVLNTEDK